MMTASSNASIPHDDNLEAVETAMPLLSQNEASAFDSASGVLSTAQHDCEKNNQGCPDPNVDRSTSLYDIVLVGIFIGILAQALIFTFSGTLNDIQGIDSNLPFFPAFHAILWLGIQRWTFSCGVVFLFYILRKFRARKGVDSMMGFPQFQKSSSIDGEEKKSRTYRSALLAIVALESGFIFGTAIMAYATVNFFANHEIILNTYALLWSLFVDFALLLFIIYLTKDSFSIEDDALEDGIQEKEEEGGQQDRAVFTAVVVTV